MDGQGDGWAMARFSEFFFKESKSKIFFFLRVCVWGGGCGEARLGEFFYYVSTFFWGGGGVLVWEGWSK